MREHLVYLLLLLVQLSWADHVALSTHELVRVLEVEEDLFRDLQLYMKELKRKVFNIRQIVHDAEERFKRAKPNPEAFVANPLNSFSLVRRMHEDAPKLLSYLKRDVDENLRRIADYRLDVLTDVDLEEATKGLLRIQSAYNLDERHMARGLLAQRQYNAHLSSLDCRSLSRYLRKQGDLQHADKWLQIALEQYAQTPEPVHALLRLDRLNLLQELSDVQRQRDDWSGMRSSFSRMMRHAKTAELKQQARAKWLETQQHFRHLDNCRGKHQLPVKAALRCRYSTAATHFLRLAPLKLEQLSLDPHVVLYHDVVSIAEREHLLQRARPFLQRTEGGCGYHDDRRTAMEARIAANASLNVKRLFRRVQDMSGLDGSSTSLSVTNYGMGGQHYMHYDCAPHEVRTFCMGLTEVQLGGRTSFPHLRLSVQPSAGAAMLWHNVNSAEKCDKRTLHAACPVLLGSRWGKLLC
ncbi:hypothetical protein KR222_008544 [Zaprionus bogoriensis]|nr:hypothetical protein KR222_008544 [Zaprionus bogoriensis]